MPIPYRMNPLGISGTVKWRNFYDNPITWTGFNALNFSLYSSVRIEIDFTTFESPRGTVNYPIFGVYAGNPCPLFLSYYSRENNLAVYAYQSTGVYARLGWPQMGTIPGAQQIIYTMTPGAKGSLLLNDVEKLGSAGTFSGYPATGNNVSQADCTIQRLQVFGDGALIWQATKAELTV